MQAQDAGILNNSPEPCAGLACQFFRAVRPLMLSSVAVPRVSSNTAGCADPDSEGRLMVPNFTLEV
jgi:hypothetical protein